MERRRMLLVAYVAVSAALPTWGLLARWLGDEPASRWAWHMFSTLP